MHENLAHSETSSLVWVKQRLELGFVAHEESAQKVLKGASVRRTHHVPQRQELR